MDLEKAYKVRRLMDSITTVKIDLDLIKRSKINNYIEPVMEVSVNSMHLMTPFGKELINIVKTELEARLEKLETELEEI